MTCKKAEHTCSSMEKSDSLKYKEIIHMSNFSVYESRGELELGKSQPTLEKQLKVGECWKGTAEHFWLCFKVSLPKSCEGKVVGIFDFEGIGKDNCSKVQGLMYLNDEIYQVTNKKNKEVLIDIAKHGKELNIEIEFLIELKENSNKNAVEHYVKRADIATL